jgi:NAD(P)-dependent dehydrogenase (short-subunit alcohol dehydrogenase family)
MNLQLSHKLALITGSTAGIGYAIAETLAAEGARVIITGRTQTAVDAAVEKLGRTTSGELIGFPGGLLS